MPEHKTAHSFDSISDKRSRILILGTMPSVQSRKVGFYYSHPQNRFWLVLAECLDQPIPETIENKTLLLLNNSIALWDVLASCEISGSDDSSIRSPVYNDIEALASSNPIEKILCNGKKAYNLYCNGFSLSLPVMCMPSTSPANAAWSMERLVDTWRTELR